MTWGNASRKGNGYYNIGGRLIYFNQKPTDEEVQQKLAEIEDESSTQPWSHINCGGDCCADQLRAIH